MTLILISRAQIHVMLTFQTTGLKLKLLNALFNGRHCLVNESMLAGTSLAELCYVAREPGDIIKRLSKLMTKDFTEEDKVKRQKGLLCFRDQYLVKELIEEIRQ